MKDWKKAIKQTKLENIIKEESENKNENNQFVECGKKVRIYISGISFEIYHKLLSHFKLNKPLIIWSLLKYENKISVCHYLIRKHNDYCGDKIPESFIFDVGFRRFKCNPIFSENSNGNKHLIF